MTEYHGSNVDAYRNEDGSVTIKVFGDDPIDFTTWKELVEVVSEGEAGPDYVDGLEQAVVAALLAGQRLREDLKAAVKGQPVRSMAEAIGEYGAAVRQAKALGIEVPGEEGDS